LGIKLSVMQTNGIDDPADHTLCLLLIFCEAEQTLFASFPGKRRSTNGCFLGG
jgi:hypothetical protein